MTNENIKVDVKDELSKVTRQHSYTLDETEHMIPNLFLETLMPHTSPHIEMEISEEVDKHLQDTNCF